MKKKFIIIILMVAIVGLCTNAFAKANSDDWFKPDGQELKGTKGEPPNKVTYVNFASQPPYVPVKLSACTDSFSVATTFTDATPTTWDPKYSFWVPTANPGVYDSLNLTEGTGPLLTLADSNWVVGPFTPYYWRKYSIDKTVAITEDTVYVRVYNNPDTTFGKVLSTWDFSIDTKRPVPTSTLSHSLITDCVVGTDSFWVQVCYDEVMDTSSSWYPKITFIPNVSTTLTNPSGSWTSDTCFRWEYDVADVDTTISNVTVIIDSAKDLAADFCNIQFPDTVYFDIDTRNPLITTLDVLPNPITDCYIDSTFYVTACYDEAMCKSSDPNLTFNPVVSHTLDYLITSSWTTDSCFVWEYHIKDADTLVNNIQVIVDGAKDTTCCNVQIPDTAYFNIYTKNPEGTITLTPIPTTLDPPDIDNCVDTFKVKICYNDSMCLSVDPVISFDPPVSGTLLNLVGTPSWITNDCFEWVYEVLDYAMFGTVKVVIDSAQNWTCCNVQEPDTAYFDVDTRIPEGIITLTPIPTTVDPPDIDNCVDTFKVKICYNNLMCQSVIPSITFDPDVIGTLLNPVASSWEFANCYEWVYEVLDYAMFGTVKVVIDSAQNWTCCNVQEPDTAYFDVDTEIPEATLAVFPNPVNGCYIDSTFTVTATYNDSMCLSVNPSIAFDPADVTDPMSANYTLELLGTPSWTPPNVFSWEYTIKDSDVDNLIVEVVVDSAQDWTCCNVQEPDTTYFDINTDSPKVLLIDVSNPLLTLCDDSLEICVTYDRKMDISFEPIIEFNPDVSSYFTIFYGGTWSPDSTVYCKYYGWTDWPEIDYDCIDIEVTDARGAADTCSIQVPDTCFCCLEIDWDRPSVVSITPSVTPSDSCVGSCDTTFSVTIVYDEPMCTIPLPTVTFANPAPSPDPFTFDPATSSWLDSYTAEINYLVTDVDGYGCCDVDIIVTDALDATCCSLNVQYPDTLLDAFDVDQIEPWSYLDAQYNDTTCTVSFDWYASDDGCPACISKVEFYVWKDGGTPSLIYTDATGAISGSFLYDLTTLVPDTLCLEGMWYGFTKAYDCCCNVEEKTLPDDSVNVVVTATKFVIRAKDHNSQSDTLRQGQYFDVIVMAVNDCGLRDCDFEECIEGCTNYNSNIVNLTLYGNPTWISGGLFISEHSVANQTMDDLIINVWKCPCCTMYSYSDPITVILPPIEPPTNTLAYDLPGDQGGWVTIDYTLSLNDPFNSIHYPTTNPAYLPPIDYYVIVRNSQPDGSGTWDAVAFVDLFDPPDSNNAHVDIQVPTASDTLYPYQMAAVYDPGNKLFTDNGKPELVSTKKSIGTKEMIGKPITGPEVVYAKNISGPKGSSQSPWANCGSAAAKDNIPAYADFTLFLEGPYQAGGTMADGLPLPTKSPYDDEDIGTLPTVTGHNLIDWIYVELRNTETGATVQETNAFVLDNGKIVDTDGDYSLPFHYTTGKQYYIVIRHRNHLAIMTAAKKTFSDDSSAPTVINLTEYTNVYGGSDAVKELGIGTGIYGIYAGDVNGDGQINNTDFGIWYNNFIAGSTGYNLSDLNMDTQVNNTDFGIWYNSFIVGAHSFVPSQSKNPTSTGNKKIIKLNKEINRR